MDKKRITVAVGLSGGVDSSVTAAILKDMGYNVIGIIMEIYDGALEIQPSERHGCYGPDEKEDLKAAESICNKLGIPFHVINLKNEYKDFVITYFKNEYLAGRTPNPCIVCNKTMKFGFLLDKAKEAGIDFSLFATGHYAKIEKQGDRFLLKQAADLAKDQTYFLYALTQQQLSKTLFPLGDLNKSKVREIAHSLGLETADKPESQDFIAGGDYTSLFSEDEIRPGQVIDETGKVLGEHKGIIHYTVGQRKGLGIASDHPLYVTRIDAENNNVVLSIKENLYSTGLIASDLNFISLPDLDKPQDIKVKIRLRHSGVDATVFPQEHNRARIIFKDPQMAVTPGQSAVFYSGDTVLGGGIIEKAL